MNTCPNCQTQNRDQAKFCGKCGQALPSAAPAPIEPARPEASGGVAVSGGQVQVGGDVAGRDVVHVTQTGLGAAAVHRLVVLIGGLGLVVGFCFLLTATCFFSGGVVLGNVIFDAFKRPVETSPEAAQRMEQRLKDLNALVSGQPFATTTTEIESSSYLRFILGPQIGVSEPKVRYLEPHRIAVSGRAAALNNLPFVVTFKLGAGASSVEIEWMAIQAWQTPDSNFGWVAVPAMFVQAQVAPIANSLLGQLKFVTIVDVTPATPAAPRVWDVIGVRR